MSAENTLPAHIAVALSQIGVIAPRQPAPVSACFAPPQWKPTTPDEEPPF